VTATAFDRYLAERLRDVAFASDFGQAILRLAKTTRRDHRRFTHPVPYVGCETCRALARLEKAARAREGK